MNTLQSLAFSIVMLFISTTSIVKAQNQRIMVDSSAMPSHRSYRVSNLTPSQPGAFFSYLWWFDDNQFQFTSSPSHGTVKTQGRNRYAVSAMITENYGTNGPPPMIENVGIASHLTPQLNVLSTNSSFYLQHYRNAVVNDTMYLIVTYANKRSNAPLSGELELVLNNDVELVDNMIQNHAGLHPNGESWLAGTTQWTFSNLRMGEERSILVPVRIKSNARDRVNIQAVMRDGLSEVVEEGQNAYSISTPVVKSHDPNLMLEHSGAESECDYRGRPIDYTIRFQNTGEGPTRYIKVVCQLDDKVDLNSITNVTFPEIYSPQQVTRGNLKGIDNGSNQAIWQVDPTNKTLTFEMHDIVLVGTNAEDCRDLETTREEVSFTINVKSNYVFGPPVIAYSDIVFDMNDPIQTDSVKTQCSDPMPVGEGLGGFQTVSTGTATVSPWIWVAAGAVVLVILGVGFFFKRKKG